MPRAQDLAKSLIAASCLALSPLPAMAGDFFFRGCAGEEVCAPPPAVVCCKPKKRCFLLPPEPPRGEVFFAIPGRVTEGQAVRVSPETVRRGIRSEAALELKKETQAETSAADDDCPPGCAKRIEKLEADVEKLAKATTRLADVLEALDKKLDAKQDKPNP